MAFIQYEVIEKMNINAIKQFLEMQNNALAYLTELIEFDKEYALKNGEKAENVIGLKAFIETQKRALASAQLLYEKHVENIKALEAEKIELEKQQRQEAQKKEKIIADCKKAEFDEDSLFSNDDYAFEEEEDDDE